MQIIRAKNEIDWSSRFDKLKDIFEHFKKKQSSSYDCIIPISGGKDSTYQVYLLTKVFNLKPLAVTFSHNWFSKIGRENLKNISDRLNVDVIEYTPNRKLVNDLATKSLKLIGDSCWHCHTGVDTFPLHIATKFNIPLLIYGEGVAEQSGKATYLDKPDYSIDYFLKFSSIYKAEDIVDNNIKNKDLNLFVSPPAKEINSKGITEFILQTLFIGMQKNKLNL